MLREKPRKSSWNLFVPLSHYISIFHTNIILPRGPGGNIDVKTMADDSLHDDLEKTEVDFHID